MKRKPKTITPLLFVQSAILLVGESVVSFGRWAVMLGLLGHCTVAKQSLWERVSAGALALLQQTLGLVLAERIRARAAALPQGLRAFQRVLIQVIVETFERIALAKAFFLSRLRLDIVLFDPQTQRPLPLLKALRRQGQLDCPVLVGRQKFPARLVAIKLPEAVAAERRRKAKQNRDRRRQPNATYLALLGWALFLTNVDRQVLSARAVAQVYGLRWRIETIFKAWKSHFRITEVPDGSPEQLLCVIYARLILLTVMLQFCTYSGQEAWHVHSPPPRSLLKMAALVGDFFLQLCLEAWQIRITEALLFQLEYPGRYERRARKNFVQKLMN